MRSLPVALLILALVSIVELRASRDTRTIDAVAIAGVGDEIRIDGQLTERSWTEASSTGEFQQREPSEGAPATHQTEVRVLFDRNAIYVAVRALDNDPASIVGLLTRRDDHSPSDWVSVLDRFVPRSPHGVRVRHQPGRASSSNVTGSTTTTTTVAGTRSGMRRSCARRRLAGGVPIPFSQLRFNDTAPDAIGFAVTRTVARANETSTWPLLAKSASGYVSSFGELRGLCASPAATERLELMPYAVGQVATAPASSINPLVRSPDPDMSVGVDLKYGLSNGLTLTGTVNPDFGQVEADPAVVNLGAFETFFDERRPFFVEGSAISVRFNNCSFYSRRIGRQPQRSMSAPD